MTARRPSCTFRASLPALLRRREEDLLTPTESAELRSHLSGCPSCRSAALADQPDLLLAGGAGEPLPSAGEGERMAQQVLAAIELERTRRRVAPRLTSRLLLRLAATLVVGAGLVAGVRLSRTPGPSPEVAAATPVPAQIESPARRAALQPTIEGVRNPGADVYEFAPASSREATVVFVVDRNADL